MHALELLCRQPEVLRRRQWGQRVVATFARNVTLVNWVVRRQQKEVGSCLVLDQKHRVQKLECWDQDFLRTYRALDLVALMMWLYQIRLEVQLQSWRHRALLAKLTSQRNQAYRRYQC